MINPLHNPPLNIAATVRRPEVVRAPEPTVSREVADFAMRDPFPRPVEFDVADELARVVLEGFETTRDGRIPIVCTPASAPRAVIDAKADWNCARCGQRVWVSPSSRAIARPLPLCLMCVIEALSKNEKPKS